MLLWSAPLGADAQKCKRHQLCDHWSLILKGRVRLIEAEEYECASAVQLLVVDAIGGNAAATVLLPSLECLL